MNTSIRVPCNEDGGDDDGATAWVFDELRKFCRDQGNFIAAAAGGLAKNS